MPKVNIPEIILFVNHQNYIYNLYAILYCILMKIRSKLRETLTKTTGTVLIRRYYHNAAKVWSYESRSWTAKSKFRKLLREAFSHSQLSLKIVTTVEPLTNDHPNQRPSLSYDHISCDGQWFLFVYESLTSDHPSYTTTPM